MSICELITPGVTEVTQSVKNLTERTLYKRTSGVTYYQGFEYDYT
jgi:hypothetical protein